MSQCVPELLQASMYVVLIFKQDNLGGYVSPMSPQGSHCDSLSILEVQTSELQARGRKVFPVSFSKTTWPFESVYGLFLRKASHRVTTGDSGHCLLLRSWLY